MGRAERWNGKGAKFMYVLKSIETVRYTRCSQTIKDFKKKRTDNITTLTFSGEKFHQKSNSKKRGGRK